MLAAGVLTAILNHQKWEGGGVGGSVESGQTQRVGMMLAVITNGLFLYLGQTSCPVWSVSRVKCIGRYPLYTVAAILRVAILLIYLHLAILLSVLLVVILLVANAAIMPPPVS